MNFSGFYLLNNEEQRYIDPQNVELNFQNREKISQKFFTKIERSSSARERR